VPLDVASASAILATTSAQRSHVVARTLPDTGVVLLARAMGGFCGDHAAELAVETIVSFALGTVSANEMARLPSRGEPLIAALTLAGDRVYASQFVQRDEIDACRGHGATVVALRPEADHVVIAHAGDCRAYRYRPAAEESGLGLLQLTTDATVRGLGDATHASGSVLLGWVGMETNSFATARVVSHLPGDIFVLVTDAVHRTLSHAELQSTLSRVRARDAATIARAVVDACARAKQPENVGVAVARVGQIAPEIRAASHEELARLVPLFQEAYRPVPSIEAGLRWVVRASWGSSIAGVAALNRDGDIGLVLDVLVSSSWKNRGVDVALLRELQAIARGEHLYELEAHVAPSAKGPFVQAGFEPVGDVLQNLQTMRYRAR
jgi:serine/threonine protein phosphatase PrpC